MTCIKGSKSWRVGDSNSMMLIRSSVHDDVGGGRGII